MDSSRGAVSRVLVLGAEPQTRRSVLNAIFESCGQKAAEDTAQGVHSLVLKTKYYTAELEIHVHEVQTNELATPLEHDAEAYEAMIWIVDASSDKSFLETEQFVGNSIEELDFNVSLLIGSDASAASLVQLRRLEQWGQTSGFEFVAIESAVDAKNQGSDPLNEKRGIERVKEALECNMWASLKTLDKTATYAAPAASTNQVSVTEDAGDEEGETEAEPPSRILVLGSDTVAQHDVLGAFVGLSGGEKVSGNGETVQDLMLKTKYYEADVELHVHRVEANELVTALHHDVDTYEALLWVVDASSEGSFLQVHRFVERSMEELSFEVCLLVGARVDHASPAQIETLEKWCRDNTFEFVGVPAAASSNPPTTSENEPEGVGRVLEALHCNMWRSMKMLPRNTEPESTPTIPVVEAVPAKPASSAQANDVSPPAATTTEPAHEDRLHASLAALSGGLHGDNDPDMEAFSGLLSQVQRIRETGAVLTDEERRCQAERVAMQLWNLLGADDSDDGGMDSD